MTAVVEFLSKLTKDEENGGIKRMLGVCSEFERIAKVVLDKTEKESHSKRKRKSHEDPNKHKTLPSTMNPGIPPQVPSIHTGHSAMQGVFSPNMGNAMNPNSFSPGSTGSGIWQPDYANGTEYMSPGGLNGSVNGMPYADIQGYANGNGSMASPISSNNFQQPFVPADLWSMPMSLDWDWSSMTGGSYPSFENGLVGDPNMQNRNGHLQNQQM